MPTHSIETLSVELTRPANTRSSTEAASNRTRSARDVVARGPLHLAAAVGLAEDDGVPQEIKIAWSIKALQPWKEMSPEVTLAILEGRQPTGLLLARIPKLLPLSWAEHCLLLG